MARNLSDKREFSEVLLLPFSLSLSPSSPKATQLTWPVSQVLFWRYSSLVQINIYIYLNTTPFYTNGSVYTHSQCHAQQLGSLHNLRNYPMLERKIWCPYSWISEAALCLQAQTTASGPGGWSWVTWNHSKFLLCLFMLIGQWKERQNSPL